MLHLICFMSCRKPKLIPTQGVDKVGTFLSWSQRPSEWFGSNSYAADVAVDFCSSLHKNVTLLLFGNPCINTPSVLPSHAFPLATKLQQSRYVSNLVSWRIVGQMDPTALKQTIAVINAPARASMGLEHPRLKIAHGLTDWGMAQAQMGQIHLKVTF